MAKITKDTLIVDCLKLNPNSAEILQSVGMHCIGCAMAHGETIEEAVYVLLQIVINLYRNRIGSMECYRETSTERLYVDIIKASIRKF